MCKFKVWLMGLFVFLLVNTALANSNTAETASNLLWRLGPSGESVVVQNTGAFPISMSQVVTQRRNEKVLLAEQLTLAAGERRVIPVTSISFGTSLFFNILNDRGHQEHFQAALQSAASTPAVLAFDPRPVID